MSCVQGLQKVKGFSPSDFSNNNSVGSMPERRFKQVSNSHTRDSALFAPCFHAHEIVFTDVQLSRVLDQQHAIIIWDEVRQNTQQSCLTGPGATADENILPLHYRIAE